VEQHRRPHPEWPPRGCDLKDVGMARPVGKVVGEHDRLPGHLVVGHRIDEPGTAVEDALRSTVS
jgi:hypothetical protein